MLKLLLAHLEELLVVLRFLDSIEVRFLEFFEDFHELPRFFEEDLLVIEVLVNVDVVVFEEVVELLLQVFIITELLAGRSPRSFGR